MLPLGVSGVEEGRACLAEGAQITVSKVSGAWRALTTIGGAVPRTVLPAPGLGGYKGFLGF